MIQKVLILGAGSAGLLAAITLKKKLPQLTVQLVRSSDIGVIGVGEGTTPALPGHLFEYLGLSQARFYAEAEPTWKLGIRFFWGRANTSTTPSTINSTESRDFSLASLAFTRTRISGEPTCRARSCGPARLFSATPVRAMLRKSTTCFSAFTSKM